MKTITPTAANESSDATYLDVRLLDDYQHSHIAGAVSNCVFEVAFTDRLEGATPDKDAIYIVYGANEKSKEAEMAIEKMERLGYTNLTLLEGGYTAWTAADLPTEGTGDPPAEPNIPEGTHQLDLGQSYLMWTGRNLLNNHNGRVGIKSGEVEIKDGKLTGGRFVIDMTNIWCNDLQGDAHDGLISHLKSHDFFDVEHHPEAVLEIRSAKAIEDAPPGTQNLIITGDLTLKGKTAPVELAAVAGVTPEKQLAAQSSFLIDRTVWNVLYGSGKLFSRVGMHLVNDLVDIEVKAVTLPPS
ncbi:MAG: sulfurtransferase [Verrucomicrobiales bacterium]|nr:sulfurtransferase [Verrucomicrobiales bacterium]